MAIALVSTAGSGPVSNIDGHIVVQHDVPAGAMQTTGILIALVAIRNSGSQTMLGVSRAGAPSGAAFTFLGGITNGTNVRLEIWYQLKPAAGGADLQLTASANGKGTLSLLQYSGVDQTTPFRSGQSAGLFASLIGNSAVHQVTLASTMLNDRIVAASARINTGSIVPRVPYTTSFGSIATTGGGATSNVVSAASEYISPSGSQIRFFDTITSTFWAAIGVVLIPAAAGTPVTQQSVLNIEARKSVSVPRVLNVEALVLRQMSRVLTIEAVKVLPSLQSVLNIEATKGAMAQALLNEEALKNFSIMPILNIEALKTIPSVQRILNEEALKTIPSVQRILNIEARKGVSRQVDLNIEALAQAVAVSRQVILNIEALRLVTSPYDLPIEASKGITQQAVLNVEALAVVAVLQQAILNIEAVKVLTATTRDLPVEALKNLSAQAVLQIEALGAIIGVSQQAVLNIEALKVLASVERAINVEATKTLPSVQLILDIEATKGSRQTAPLNIEALKGVAHTHVLNIEAYKTLAATLRVLNIEALKTLSPTELALNIEALKSLSAAALSVLNIEAAKGLTKSQDLYIEALRNASYLQVLNLEALKGVIAQAIPDIEALKGLSIPADLPVEAIKTFTAQITIDVEAILSLTQQAILNIEATGGAAPTTLWFDPGANYENIDFSKYAGVTFRFVAWLATNVPAFPASARLQYTTDMTGLTGWTDVPNSTIQQTAPPLLFSNPSSPVTTTKHGVWTRSAPLTGLPAGEALFRVQFGGASGGGATITFSGAKIEPAES
jgi:DNA-binding XRE family transcriptional regulator